jgi:hypothetical protein
MDVLLDQTRTAAGLTGREVRVSVSAPGMSPFLRFTWEFEGVPYSAAEPFVQTVATAPPGRQSELEEIWAELLGSLKRIPAAPA